MLVICEDCAKRYNVDEGRIKGEKARFSCYECGHIIVVKKLKIVEPSSGTYEAFEFSEAPEINPMTDDEIIAPAVTLDSLEENENNNGVTSKVKGGSRGILLKIALIAAFLIIGSIIAYLYLNNHIL